MLCWWNVVGGQASGLTYEQRKETFPDGIIPQQEEFEPLQQRAMQAMNDIIRQHEGKHVIVVSHGALINAVLHAVSHGEFGSFKTRLANACISILQYNNSSWNVLFYNKTVDELL